MTGRRPESAATDFDAIYAATAPRLVGQLYLLIGDLSEAQDCVQEAFARAWLRAVTLPYGLQAWLTLGTDLTPGRPGYEIYILSKGYTFYMFTSVQPNFDFKTLVTSPQFADMAAKALAEPEG